MPTTKSEEKWSPQAVGELFLLVMMNGNKQLMRVTEITSADRWQAESADLDDAMRVYVGLPEVTL